ncbi:N-acetyltransferase [Sphingomonas sp. DBB INV C78]|uniref:GNAT family N-acetyltransferase n=1 Tax=Sphingomonas sp. DBB INV C78 TaxID=3349434 RepID=UPI0036D3E001
MATSLHPRLRVWREEDFAAYRALHADPQVAYWLGGALTTEEARLRFDRMRSRMADNGWGIWAIIGDDNVPVGAAGLQPVPEILPFAPAIEAAWRLRSDAQGRGYVTETMGPVLADGFARLGVDEILAFTATSNSRSRAVMERLGFRHDTPGDFDHPALAESHPLHRHVLYRLSRTALL